MSENTKNSYQRPHPETLAATADHFVDIHTGAITPAVATSTTFARDNRYEPLNSAHIYARDGSPAFVQAERVLTELEQGQECCLFASGMAAIAAIFYTLTPGSHVVLPRSMYWGVVVWTRRYCQRNDISIGYYDAANVDSIRLAASGHARLEVVWVETPSNPLLHITDIVAAADIAHELDAVLIVDSTAATPVFTQPLTLGADIVMHSATKYLNGHSDVLAGALVTREQNAFWESITQERQHAGAVPGTFESWLLLRGMRTLYLRVERAAANAQQIAQALQQHNAISKVLYPGLQNHPGHTVAKRQMRDGFGALLSFQVVGGAHEALQVTAALQSILSATSLGGVETLIEHRYSVEPPETGIPENLLRLAVGIEHVDDLLFDLDQALNTLL